MRGQIPEVSEQRPVLRITKAGMHGFGIAALQAYHVPVLAEDTPVFGKFLNTRQIGVTTASGKKDVVVGRKLFRVGKDGGFIRAAGIDGGIAGELQPDIPAVPAEGLYIGGSVFSFEKNKVSVEVGHCFSPGVVCASLLSEWSQRVSCTVS